MCYLYRWDTRLQDAGLALTTMTPLTLKEQFLYPLTFYLAWQLFYICVQFTIIEKNKTLITSLRWFVQDHKNPAVKMIIKLVVCLGNSNAKVIFLLSIIIAKN